MGADALHRQQEVVDVYRRVMGIIWGRLSPTFGIRTINAIARNVIARKAAQYPALAYLTIGQDGIVWDKLEANLAQVDEDTVRPMLDEFLDEFFEALSTLIGRLVVGKILNHTERDVTAVYDRHSYDRDKEDALLRWDLRLRDILGNDQRQRSGKVVELATAEVVS
jgi:hypothetical protein